MEKMIQSHEDRIQRIEDAIMASSARLAEHGITLEGIQQSVEETKVGIERKIEQGFEAMRGELRNTNEQVRNLASTVSSQNDRLRGIESAESERKKRSDIVRKVAIWVMMGAGGVVIKEVVQFVIANLK